MAEINSKAQSTPEKNENAIANLETEGLSQRQIILKRFVKHKAAMGSLFTLIFIILFVFSASGLKLGTKNHHIAIPGWWPYSITQIDPEGVLL